MRIRGPRRGRLAPDGDRGVGRGVDLGEGLVVSRVVGRVEDEHERFLEVLWRESGVSTRR